MHTEKAHAGFWRGAAARCFAVVLDAQDDVGRSRLDPQLHAARLGMFRGVGDRFLRDTIKIGADALRQIVDPAGNGDIKSRMALLDAIPACNETFEALGEAEFFDLGRA